MNEHDIDDQLELLLANGKRITDCIYDGDDSSLNCKEAHLLGHHLARIMTCYSDERTEAIENLRELFTRPLRAEAEAYCD